MRALLERLSSEYAAALDKRIDRTDDQSSIRNPVLFLFIGDKAAEAIQPIIETNEKKWDNHAGVVYFHVHSSRVGSHPRADSFAVRHPEADPKTLRKAMYDGFQQDGSLLFEMNKTLRQLSNKIAEFGRLYATFERIHICVVTRVDDPLNVLMPQITVLTKAIFAQSFKTIQVDLFALISEKDQAAEYGYSTSVGISFLKELQYVQDPDYSFTGDLMVTENGIKIPVTRSRGALFDLAYILSDKNERGIIDAGTMRENYELIVHINLLKNRKLSDQTYAGQLESYNNMTFKNNIITSSNKQAYVSAGFAKVKRPNQAIFLVVVYHFYNLLFDKLKSGGKLGKNEMLQFFELDPVSFQRKVSQIVPDAEVIEEMTGLIPRSASYAELKNMTLREAENVLFADTCGKYFQENVELAALAQIANANVQETIDRAIGGKLTDNPEIGIYSMYVGTRDDGESGILGEVRKLIRETAKGLASAKTELEQYYQEHVVEQPFKRIPFMDSGNLRKFIRLFFEKVYGKKLEIARLDVQLRLAKLYESELERFHQEMKLQVLRLEQIGQQLHDIIRSSMKEADDYIGQNVTEYYRVVTERIVQQLESKRGEHFIFEERFVGNLAELLQIGDEALVARLAEICSRDILTAEPFMESFEDELLHRANVNAEYGNKQILSKDELFKELYNSLNNHAEINIQLFNYTHEHRYEEKYFFGDLESEFITYAFKADEKARNYRLGCIHEKRHSGVEKLHLMGGFHLEDLMYCKNGAMYYHSYTANGFEFHGIDPEKLPNIC